MQKKQKNKERGVLYSALVLLLITGLIACLVAVVNSVTKPVIEEHDAEKVAENINIIFPDKPDYGDITADCEKKGLLEGAEGVMAVYEVKSGSLGGKRYCIKSKAAGYGGDVEVLVGFDCGGAVSGVRLLSLAGETPGIGQRINDEKFLNRFSDWSPQPSGNSGKAVQGISGATVSSTAAVKAVNSACVAMCNILGLGKPISESSEAQSSGAQFGSAQSDGAQSGGTQSSGAQSGSAQNAGAQFGSAQSGSAQSSDKGVSK